MADFGGVAGLMMGASAIASGACYLNSLRVPAALRDSFESASHVLCETFQPPADPAPEIEQVLDQINDID